jgi:hypothetical protein
MILLILVATAGMYSCKSQKKMAAKEAAETEAKKIAKAKADLELLLSDNSGLTLVEKESRLNSIKALNIEDPEVKALIVKVEDKLKREREALTAKERAEQLTREREEQLRREGAAAPKGLAEYFDLIAKTTDLTASNKYITEALGLFANENVPVLIIIAKSGDVVDYDRPTTIRKYLEYIKDQKISSNSIENVVYDASGKITELELIKK